MVALWARNRFLSTHKKPVCRLPPCLIQASIWPANLCNKMVLSAYEQQRERNIAANQKVLEGMGIEPPERAPAPKKRKSSTSSPATAREPTEPTRKSSRVSTTPAAAATAAAEGSRSNSAPREKKLSDVPPWEREVFHLCEQAHAGSSGAVWDASKHHQHLSLSASRRAVATTGVAGYGAALAKRAPGCRHWAVRAVRFGVGGFGVAIVRSSMKPPYKSIGKTAGVVGAYLASGVFATPERGEVAFGPPFEPGDLIEVSLRPSALKKKGGGMDVVYSLNGREVGVAASGVASGTDGLIMACQPYMGGVALLQ